MDRLMHELLQVFSVAVPGSPGINRTKLHWLIRLRTIATIAQTLSFIPGVQLGLIRPGSYLSYFIVIGVLTLCNGLSFVRLTRRAREPGDHAVFAQLAVDLTGLTVLLNLSGGWHNPFVSLYFLHAALGSLLLRRALDVTFFVLVVYGICVTFYLTGAAVSAGSGAVLPGTTLLLTEIFIAFVIWILTSWLAATLRQLDRNVQVLREQNSRLDRLRAVGAIAAGFSHRLATPLNTVKMRLERAVRRGQELPVYDDVRIALQSVERCEDILRTYFADRLEPGSFAPEPIDMVPFVEQICTSWWLDNGEVDLRLNVQRGGQLLCLLSPVAFSRSLIDMLDNARQAQDGATPVITVRLRRNGDAAELRIDDNGPGFSEDVMARLGEPFLSEKTDGAGLGLFTAFALTHSLSGHFTVRNRDTGGGSVMLCLPLIETEYVHDTAQHIHADR